MCKSLVSLFLCLLLAVPGLAQPTTKQTEKEIKLKQKIVAWGTQKNVTVKLNSGEKFEGHLAVIKDDSFTIQFIAPDGKVTEHNVLYSSVDKLSSRRGSKAGRIVGNTALYVLAGLGIFALGVLILQARN